MTNYSPREACTQGSMVPPEVPRTIERVVATLRVDSVGSAAFGTSRSYFAKGVQQGKVYRAVGPHHPWQAGSDPAARPAWQRLDAKDTLAEGDVVRAVGLGEFTVEAVLGETRKGRVRVRLRSAREGRPGSAGA